MAAELSDSSDQLKGAQGNDRLTKLSTKINYLKKQIQDERAAFVKDLIRANRKRLRAQVSEIFKVTDRSDAGSHNLLSSRICNPVSKLSGYGNGSGDKDYVHCSLVSTTLKLRSTRKIPPYTSWIFLDRNQRMAEDQSVVGRRRIYYDNQYDGEALICSDSEEEVTEPEEEKHEFSEGEERILWMAFEEHGVTHEVVNIVSQFIKGTAAEIQERYNILKEKQKKKQDSEERASEKSICLDKSLSVALDSFDNLFCRRCLVFDCRLHGCSQSIIDPCEKYSCVPEIEEAGKPCSNECYLSPSVGAEEISDVRSLQVIETEKRDERGLDVGCSPTKDEHVGDAVLTSEPANSQEHATSVPNQGTVSSPITDNETSNKRKLQYNTSPDLQISALVADNAECFLVKKPKLAPENSEAIQISDNLPSDKTANPNEDEPKYVVERLEKYESSSSQSKQLKSSVLIDWKPIERELYLKGVEIFGKNSCLISRNMLSGWKTCREVFAFMYDNGASANHKSTSLASSSLGDSENPDADSMEIATKSRLFRKRGKTKKLKYSWKSAGHPSFWKRIVDGKNQSCKQYTPCECQSMCGKQCSCLQNETCCEKYCGCSKNCKNRFRGCQCAKSQCRSRQCPCFAAGRECDPDVCRNCWVSCGDGTLGEPPRRGDGQCGNMRLLLRQQQKVLLGKSDVAGWGAFIKNSVNKNDYLGEYTGELISHREADKRGKIYDLANSSFLFDLNDQYVLDAYRKGDKLKFANHSPHPNCYAQVLLVAGDHRVGIFAKERIEAGEELFYDYRYGPDQAPAWARKPESSKRDDSSISQGRAKKHQSH
ncbi:unnamed protein product [Rhodiola kirilowii]